MIRVKMDLLKRYLKKTPDDHTLGIIEDPDYLYIYDLDLGEMVGRIDHESGERS